MKKKILAAVLGTAFASIAAAGSASAMTYGYTTQGKNGPVEWFVTEQDGEIATETDMDVAVEARGSIGMDAETEESAGIAETDITAEVQSETETGEITAAGHSTFEVNFSGGDVMSDEEYEKYRRVQMQEAIAYLEKFGVSYDADSDAIYYQGRKVRWLVDDQTETQTSRAIHMPDGEIDLYTVRGEDYQLTGVRVADQEEYDEKTQQDLLAEQNLEITCVLAGSAEDLTLKNADGSITYKLEEEALKNADGSVTYRLETEAQKDTDDSITCTLQGADVQTGSDLSITYSTEGKADKISVDDGVMIEQDCQSTYAEATDDYYDSEAYAEYQKKADEYAKFGLTAEDSAGGWLWNGKTVYCLMDEDGSFTQNGSASEKIYILVTRNEDGSIDEVKEVTLEDILREKVKNDALNE